jgi:tetratricopeptide (TPR) repeat protein
LSDPIVIVEAVSDLLSIRPGARRGLLRGTGATVWYERGCALEASDLRAAAAAYRRAIAGRPDHADAHNNLGRVLHELPGSPDSASGDDGGAARAEVHYRLAVAARGDVALYWFNLGVALEDQGRAADAIAAYEQALQLDPHLADAHFNLARQYEQRGKDSRDDLVLRRAVNHLVRYRALARKGA